MATTFQERVKILAKRAGNATELARRSGLSRRTIGAYMAGETDPKRGDLLKLAVGAKVSLEWLADGKGEPDDAGKEPGAVLQYHSDAIRNESSWPTVRSPSPLDYGLVFLPLYELRAGAASQGVVVEDGERPVTSLAFRQEWIRNTLRVKEADLRLIYVEGDSMEPDLRPGDIILIDHSDTTVRREGIYVIRMEGALLVKQVQRVPGGVLKLISRNPAYEPIMVQITALDDPVNVAIIGRVVWACRRF